MASAEGSSDSAATPSHDELVDSSEQPFLDHIIELRSRILRGMLIVLVLFFPIYFYANELYGLVAAPLMAHLPNDGNMIATDVTSPFLTPFKLSIFAAIFLGMPFLLHQIWGFISPGLYLHEKRFATPLLLSSIALFYLGIAFAYFLVFPLIFKFMAGVTPEGVTMMTDINRYLDFVLKMFFAFGFAFEIPIATLLLAWSGLATADGMAAKSRHRRRSGSPWLRRESGRRSTAGAGKTTYRRNWWRRRTWSNICVARRRR